METNQPHNALAFGGATSTVAANDLGWRDAVETGRSIRAGHLDPADALERAHAAAKALNPRLNAVVRFVEPDAAALAAANRNSPLWGVPFLLKDAFAWLKGSPTSNGSRLLASSSHKEDSVIVQRFKAAGLQIFGKTTCPEFNSLGTTESADFGVTVNPWDASRSAGGSSGGSAAAVAARIVPAAHGSDGAGSIRIPASCCGLVGLKPSRGRVSLAPVLGESVGGCMSEGVLSVSVTDSAALLDAIAGPAPGDSYTAPQPRSRFLEAAGRAPGRLRIAVTVEPFLPASVDPQCVLATEEAARLCATLGHEVVRGAPPIDGARYKNVYSRLWPVNVARSIRRLEPSHGKTEVWQSISSFNRHLCDLADDVSAVELVHCLEWMQGVARQVAGWMRALAIDVWLTPTLTQPPAPLGHFDADVHGAETVYQRFLEQTAFTTLANMTGLPAVSLPLHWSPEGLPIGVQFTAAYGAEDLLFSLARSLEAENSWTLRLPPVSAIEHANPSCERHQ